MAEGKEEKGFRKCVFSQINRESTKSQQTKKSFKKKKKHTETNNLKLLCEGGVNFSAPGNGRQGGRGTTALS